MFYRFNIFSASTLISIFLGISISLSSIAATTEPPAQTESTQTPIVETVSASSVEATPALAENTIEIQSVRRPDDLPYSSFVSAMRTFDDYRHYAPEAILRFGIYARGDKNTLRVNITGNQISIPVPLNAKGHFTLPIRQDALDDDAYVTSNRREGDVSWGVDAKSPGVPHGMLRLGDVRLTCRVYMELQRKDTSIFLIALSKVLGGCNSDGHMTFSLKRPGMKVKFKYQDREEILADKYYVTHHTQWTAPLTDGNWPDDTLIEFIEPDSNFVLDSECAEKMSHDAEHPYTHGVKSAGAIACLYQHEDDDDD